tara:strand:- start:4282 stop:11496 length:7215 start_codon:yes stop_codon:yes gene_type:complete
MGIFQVDFADGNSIRVEAPRDATEEEIKRLARQILSEQETRLTTRTEDQTKSLALEDFARSYEPARYIPPTVEDDGTFTGRFLRGIQTGAVGTFESAALGAATALDEGAELRARDNIQGIAGLLKADDEGADTFAYQLGSGFGSFAGFVGAGIGAAALAPYAGLGIVGAGIAGTATAVGLGSAAGAGEASERARAFGATEAERSAAARRGAAIGSLEGLPVGRLAIRGAAALDIVSPIVNKIAPAIGQRTAKIFGDRITSALGTAGIEGAQETASAILQNLNERGYNEEAAIVGEAFKEGGIGAIVGGTAGLLLGRRGGPQVDAQSDEEIIDELAGTRQKIDAVKQDAQLLEGERENELRSLLREELPKTEGAVTGEIRAKLDTLGGLKSESDLEILREEVVAARERQGIYEIPADKVQLPVSLEQLNQAMRGETSEQRPEVQDPDRLKAAAARAKAGIPALITKEGEVLSDSAKDVAGLENLGIMTQLRLEEEATRQERARKRAEESALARDDVAAFVQPDLLADELESTAEKRPEAALRDQLRRQGEEVPQRTSVEPAKTEAERERDFNDLLREQARREVAEQTQKEATAETAQSKLATDRATQTEAIRTRILQNTVANAGEVRKPKALQNLFEKALIEEGLTNTKATPAEVESIRRASNVIRARKPPIEIIPDVKSQEQIDLENRVSPDRKNTVDFTPLNAAEDLKNVTGRDAPTTSPVDAGRGEGDAGVGTSVEAGPKDVQATTRTDAFDSERLGSDGADAPSAVSAKGREPSALDNYGYRQSLPSQEYAQKKQKAAEDGAKKKGASSSAKKLVNGPQTGFIGTDSEKPLFLDTDFVASLKGVNDEVVGPSNAKYKAIKKSVEKEGFDPDQKGSTVFIDVNHKGEAFIAEGNNRAAVAKEFGIPSIKAEVRYYNGAEEVDSAVSPQNIIQNARSRPVVEKPKPEQKPKVVPGKTKKDPFVKRITGKKVLPILDLKKRTTKALAPEKPIRKKTEVNETARENTINKLFSRIFSKLLSTDALTFSMNVATPRMQRLAPEGWLSREGKRKILRELSATDIGPDGKVQGEFKIRERRKPANEKDAQDRKRTEGRNAFQRYFGNYEMPEYAIEDILYHLNSPEAQTKVEDTDTDVGVGQLGKDFFTGDDTTYLPSYGQKSAKAAYDLLMNIGLPDRDVKAIERILTDQKISIEEMPLQPEVIALLRGGDLSNALQRLQATIPNKFVRQFVNRTLLENIGDTKIKVQDKVQLGGNAVEGRYDPSTNTIILSKKDGMNVHALLHEAAHAVTIKNLYRTNRKGETVLRNTPDAKRIERLRQKYVEIHGENTYGTQDAGEFASAIMLDEGLQDALDDLLVQDGNKLVRGRENFVQTLIRMFRGRGTQTKGVNDLINAIVSPSAEHAGMRSFYLAAKSPEGSREILDDVPEVPIKADKNYFERVRSEILGPATPDFVKNGYLALQDAYILGQVAKDKIPFAPQLNQIINQMSGELRAENRRVDALTNKLRELRKTNDKDYKTLRYLIPHATHRRIDPRAATFKEAWTPKKEDAEDIELARKTAEATYKDLRKQFTNMSEEGQKLYMAATNFYESGLKDIMDSIDANLKAAGETDAKARKTALEKLLKTMGFDRQRIRPYAKLERSGPYRMEYTTLDPTTKEITTYVEYFDNKLQRRRAMKMLDEYNKSLGDKLPATAKATKPILGTRDDYTRPNARLDTGIAADIMKILKATKAPKETQEAIAKVVLSNMPERSFLKGYIGRGDVRGFLGDITPTGMAEQNYDLLQQLERAGRDYSRQKVQMKYGAKLREFDKKLLDDFNYKTLDDDTKLLRDRLLRISSFASSPNIPQLSRMLTSAGFGFTMGFNISSASLTFFDVFMSASPYLSSRYGRDKMYKAYGRSMRLLHAGGRQRAVKTFGAKGDEDATVNAGPLGNSISNIDYNGKKPEGMTDQEFKDLAIAVEVGDRNAVFNQTITQEMLEIGDDPFFKKGDVAFEVLGVKIPVPRVEGTLGFVNRWSSFLFHHSERFNREVVYMSSYMLQLQKMRESGKEPTKEDKIQAAYDAVDVTQLTLGSTAAGGRPTIAQTGLGNVAFLFKRFAISKYYLMTRMANDVIKSYPDTPEGKQAKTIARKQLTRFLVTTGALAGVAGMPMMGMISFIYDGIMGDEEDDFDSMARKVLGEGVYGGALNAMFDVEMSSRISMNSLLYRPPIIDKDQNSIATLIEQLGGPVVGQYLNVERGIGLFNEGEIYRGLEAISPAFLRSLLRSGRFSVYGAETRRGDEIVDTGVYNNAMQAIGYAPADYIKVLGINKNERRKDQTLTDKRKKLLRRYNMALTEGAFDEIPEIMKDIIKYNRNLPPSARGQKLIFFDSLKRSRRSFVRTTQRMRGGMEFKPFMLDSLEEYDQGLNLFA